MCMNGWFIAAGTLLIAAFFVHVVSGNRFYTAACPGRNAAADKAYEAWLMGRCGVQMITADLALGAVFLLLLGFGVIPRNFQLELFLLLTYGGWFLLWLVSLGYERAAGVRLRPTTLRKPIRSTTPRDCGSAPRNPDSRFTSPTSVRASSIRRWPRVTVCSG